MSARAEARKRKARRDGYRAGRWCRATGQGLEDMIDHPFATNRMNADSADRHSFFESGWWDGFLTPADSDTERTSNDRTP